MCAILFSSSASSSTPYVIKVDKSDSTLLVETNRGETIKTFSVATGRGGKGDKKKIGDKKTPVGTYYVTGFNEKSKFDYFIRINYPNLKDAYYGYKSRKINNKTKKTTRQKTMQKEIVALEIRFEPYIVALEWDPF